MKSNRTNTMKFMESDETLYTYSLMFLYISGTSNLFILQFLQAPYGKHLSPSWGPTVSPTLAWVLMESPTIFLPLLLLLLFPLARHRSSPRSLSLLSLFLLHYLHRTFIYPFYLPRRAPTSKPTQFPISIALMAFSFNVLNAYVQSRSISHYIDYDAEGGVEFWVRFFAGLGVFLWGMSVNVRSDLVLVRLRGEGKGYRVPTGGWFERVSCANYFGEIVEWFGWAVMTASWAGFGFFLYTFGNLVPRARAHHKWYKDKFGGGEYPESRKAVIPFLY